MKTGESAGVAAGEESQAQVVGLGYNGVVDREQSAGELVMVFQGHIENGVAVFDEPAGLPEGMKVRIVPVVAAPVVDGERRTLAERFKNIIGAARNLPDDMAENHDHYLHGTPKQ